jgi:hypothetical protein
LLESEPQRLIDLLLEQSRLLAELREEVARLREERDTQPPGGVAPFRRPEHRRSQNPRRPGRPAGHPGSYRRAPEQEDQVVEVPLKQCPCCGESIEQSTPLEQTIIELPAVRPVVTRLITHQACCPGCGRQVQSTHPMQVSSAIGAAGTQLGPQALSVAGVLRHELHMTVRKSCQALESLFGLSISPGGLCQALDRVAERVRPQYEKLKGGLSGVRALYADETGWYLENHRAMLWVFCHPEATVYQVVEHRDRATFHRTVPTDFCGVLVSDCLSVYDGATDHQQKCYSHHLHAISEARRLREKPSSWLDQIESLLHTAMALGRKREEYSEEEWQKHLQVLKLAAQVSFETPRACPHEESVRQRICKQADHLFTFLEYEGVDATNNLAERQLRPAVIRRKLSCGNKSRKGANTFEVLASLAATCKQTARSFFHLLLSSLKPHPT